MGSAPQFRQDSQLWQKVCGIRLKPAPPREENGEKSKDKLAQSELRSDAQGGALWHRRIEGLVFRCGGFRTEQEPDGDHGAGAGGDDGGVGRGDVRLEEGGVAATAVPGADRAGDAVSGGGRAGGPSDALARTDRPMPAGGGSAAEGGASLRSDGGEHHQRPEANGRGRVLRGPEAGFDSGL